MEEEENQINIELSEEMAEGVYANLVMIAHSNSEFVLDFIRLMPGVPKAKVKSRVILTPEHAQRLFHQSQKKEGLKKKIILQECLYLNSLYICSNLS